jgi:hypothetical protein
LQEVCKFLRGNGGEVVSECLDSLFVGRVFGECGLVVSCALRDPPDVRASRKMTEIIRMGVCYVRL